MTKTNTTPEFTAEVLAAARCFIRRKDRTEHPSGEFDNASRFYPDAGERCDCCDYVRTPSRNWPNSYMLHCRTAEHVANLYGVDVTEVRRAARMLRANPAFAG